VDFVIDFMNKIIIWLIIFYQKYISPLKPGTCRFYPSCSEYAVQALKKYGFFKGLRLSLGRILRCHPFSPGGYDPLSEIPEACVHNKAKG
jgi:putative membrane protein insertion efficiency factor